jgi:nucleoside-diphosphate kinase
MKLSDLLQDDWVVAPLKAASVEQALVPILLRALPEAEGGEQWATDFAEGLASGGAGEIVRINDEVVVAVGSLESLDGVTLGIGVAEDRFQAMAEGSADPGHARVVFLVLSPKRPAGARQQLVPPIGRALRDPGRTETLIAAGVAGDVGSIRGVLDVEFRPRLFVEDALVPVQYRVYPETPFSEVIDLMVRREVHAVPVVGEGYEVLGILTSGDALEHLLHRGRPGDGEQGRRPKAVQLEARSFMKRSVLCVSEDHTLVDAANMLVNRDVEQLPVVRDGELMGFVTRKSILRALHRTLESEDNGDAEAGFTVRSLRMTRLTAEVAGAFYAVHRERPFYESLVAFMTSGPCIPMVLEADDAVTKLRETIGATDPAEAAEGTVRKLYAESKERNAIHASDSDDNSAIERSFFFSTQDTIGL